MRHLSTLLVLLAAACALGAVAHAQVGTSYCFGVGCPCGNDDPTAGCGNSGFDGITSTGGLLFSTGTSADVGNDDVGFVMTGMQPMQYGQLFMGGSQLSLAFGDGKRCVGAGAAGIYRYAPRLSNAFGEITEPHVISTSAGFPAGGQIVAGATWHFQALYRDIGGPCGNQFNLTNAVSVTFGPIDVPDAAAQLVGESLAQYPFFEYVRSVNLGDVVRIAVDPSQYPAVVGVTADVYVVEARDLAGWAGNPNLTDVSGSPRVVSFVGGTIQANTFVIDAGFLGGPSGTAVGRGYDVVVDLDRDGVLDDDDLIDGLSDEAGFYICRDIEAAGPYAVTEIIYSGGGWLGEDTYYPTSIAALGQLPVIIVSHGNGHNYQWYDHIGFHMASYGYVVMSHQNNTGPGIESASTTILDNTNYFLGNFGTIGGGVLAGHIDVSRVTWIGHSRGGEGVTRAYDRLFDGETRPNFGINQIQLVSSIAPTDFLGAGSANPHGVDYHLWTGAADADVNGSASCDICQTFHLLERATGRRANTVYQGVGHGAFHDGGGSLVASGPCLVDRPTTHMMMLPYFLALNRYYVDGDLASKDFLWRQYESFHAIGSPDVANPCIVATYELKEDPSSEALVIDDYQTNTALNLSSSGGTVTWSVGDALEGLLNDNDGTFAWMVSDPMNGMTRMRPGETTRGIVFSWNGAAFYEQGVVPAAQDFTDYDFLTFRGAQTTQHPFTLAVLGDTTFRVTLRDGSGTTSSISIGAYGGGLEQPYQRSGGWHNEFETIRIRLTDYLNNGSGLDLTDIVAVRFEFGGAGQSAQGYIGLDDIALTLD